MKRIKKRKNNSRTFMIKFVWSPLCARIRWVLACVMLLGSPAPWLTMLLSTSVRVGLPAFAASLLLSARVMGQSIRGKQAKAGHVMDFHNLSIGDYPSDADFAKLRLFDEAFLPTSGPVLDNENHDLSLALQQTVKDNSDESLQALADFVASHPQSRWILSLELNRGLTLYRRGYYSTAVDAFQSAWDAGKNESATTNLGAKRLADRALSELLRMNSRVGRMGVMQNLLQQMKDRHPENIAGRNYEQGIEALSIMKNDPGKAFFCGPYGLQMILASQNSKKANDPLFMKTQSTSKGFSLSEVWDMSQQVGMGMQMAKRKPGSKVLLPALVNWKLGHYAALVEEKNGLLHSVDPTFGNDTWLSEKALDVEGSGYFLVPDGALPDGWEKVGAAEGGKVYGKGFVAKSPPPPPPPCKKKAPPPGTCPVKCKPTPPPFPPKLGNPNGDNSNNGGMPKASIDVNLVAVEIADTPLNYEPPFGPEIPIQLSYNQKSEEPLPFSNFGPNWSFNWEGYVRYNFSGTLASGYALVSPGGGEEAFTPGGFSGDTQSQVNTSQTFASGAAAGLPSAFTVLRSDGWTEVYSQAVVGMSQVQVYLTQMIDPRGETLSIQYDNSTFPNRMASFTDALSQTTTFDYTDGSDSFKVTRITDPFGRHADFSYDGTGHLQSITDQLGLTSSFTYGSLSADWVTSMTTPYGTTTFDYTGTVGGNGTEEVEITDPVGLKEHVRWNEFQSVPEQYSQVPDGIYDFSRYLEYRNTLYWDKKAMADAPLDPSSAKVYHWLHLLPARQQANVLESYKAPLESRVWYNYPGQRSGFLTGTPEDGQFEFPGMQTLPTETGRIFVNSDGSLSTKLTHATYNNFGQKTSYTDPKGRKFTYTYAANGIDLLSVQDGLNEVLESYTYDSGNLHEVLTHTDASGKTTHYGYNAAGQLTTVTTPLGETTTYNYDSQGHLQSMVPPQLGGTVTYTYDPVVTYRVQTKTDAVNGTVTYSYDNMDRVTRIDYPDGSFELKGYDRLDLQSSQDRLGRVTTYGHDNDRRMTDVTDPKTQTTHYGWCSCGSIENITDPKGNQTHFDRDLEGRVVGKRYSDGSSYSYIYDSGDGNLILQKDALGQLTIYSHDVDDKLTAISYINPKNPTPNVGFQYDSLLGRLTQMQDGTGTTSYIYNSITPGVLGAGRLKSETSPVGTSAANTTYAYDADGRVISRAVDGVAENINFINDELTGITNPLGTFGYQYDSASARLTEVDLPNGQKVQFDFFTPTDPNGSGHMKDITNLGAGSTNGQTLSKFSYAYDPAGEIKTWTQQLDNAPADAKTYGMGYDQASQLAGVTLTSGTGGVDNLTAGQSVTFDYDASGNRTKEHAPSFDRGFGTNNLNQLTNITPNPINVKGNTNRTSAVTVNGTGTPEDANNQFQTDIAPAGGNQTPLTILSVAKDGTTTVKKNHVLNTQPFIYDANGNLTQDDQKIYQWDAENRLVQVSYINAQPTVMADTIHFQYDSLGRRTAITELHGTTVLTDKRFLWCETQPCQERDATGHTIAKRFFAQGEQINGVNYFYTRDHLGSVREMTDSSGVVQAKYDYDAWGRQIKLAGTLDVDFGYAGYYTSRTAGLDLALYRAYDPEKGRWLNRDPSGERSGLNLFEMVKNNPINNIDVLGLCCNQSFGDCYSNCVLTRLGGELRTALEVLFASGLLASWGSSIESLMFLLGGLASSLETFVEVAVFAGLSEAVIEGMTAAVLGTTIVGLALAAIIGGFVVGYVLGVEGDCAVSCALDSCYTPTPL